MDAKKVSATEFKAKCLNILDEVYRTGQPVAITKRGEVVAELVAPSASVARGAGAGFAKSRLTIIGDIMEPIDVDWEGSGDLAYHSEKTTSESRPAPLRVAEKKAEYPGQ